MNTCLRQPKIELEQLIWKREEADLRIILNIFIIYFLVYIRPDQVFSSLAFSFLIVVSFCVLSFILLVMVYYFEFTLTTSSYATAGDFCRLFQLTWLQDTGFIYDRYNFSKVCLPTLLCVLSFKSSSFPDFNLDVACCNMEAPDVFYEKSSICRIIASINFTAFTCQLTVIIVLFHP